jgi:sporulation protein YlmC with PRC-barrel domain
MRKRDLIITAIGALLATAALAQSPAPPSSMGGSGAPTSGGFITEQGSNQLLASKFRGAEVLGPDDQKIGNVSDILFDQSGKIDGYVVSVGGFLGVGSKEVAMAPSSFQVVNDNNTVKLKTILTKDELKEAANFQPRQERTTTGSAMAPHPGTSPQPAEPR